MEENLHPRGKRKRQGKVPSPFSQKRDSKTPSWVEQEKEGAEDFQGRTTPGSGSGHQKGDIVARILFLTEAKTTGKKSIKISRSWLTKIIQEAWDRKRHPALLFGFDEMPFGFPHDFMAVPKEIMQYLFNLADACQRGDNEEILEWLERLGLKRSP